MGAGRYAPPITWDGSRCALRICAMPSRLFRAPICQRNHRRPHISFVCLQKPFVCKTIRFSPTLPRCYQTTLLINTILLLPHSFPSTSQPFCTITSQIEPEMFSLTFATLAKKPFAEIVSAPPGELTKVMQDGPEPFSQKADSGNRNEVLATVLELKQSIQTPTDLGCNTVLCRVLITLHVEIILGHMVTGNNY